jgi:hypothetical protein
VDLVIGWTEQRLVSQSDLSMNANEEVISVDAACPRHG